MGPDSNNSTDLSSCQDSRPEADEKLRREVLYPQRQSTGVGVMLVASAAMFFAVASSAFILRAQMPQRSCPHAVDQGPTMNAIPVELVDDAFLGRAIESCSEPYYEENPDGTVSVFFDLCSSIR